jgi:hypothetical protein
VWSGLEVSTSVLRISNCDCVVWPLPSGDFNAANWEVHTSAALGLAREGQLDIGMCRARPVRNDLAHKRRLARTSSTQVRAGHRLPFGERYLLDTRLLIAGTPWPQFNRAGGSRRYALALIAFSTYLLERRS